MAQQASVVHLVNEILCEAVDARASDIHIESQATGVKIRYRIDGVLQTQPMPPEINRFQAAIISRLKIMSKMNIAEKRIPQDGRIKLKVSRPRSRYPRFGHSHASRRKHRHACPGQGCHAVFAARHRHGR